MRNAVSRIITLLAVGAILAAIFIPGSPAQASPSTASRYNTQLPPLTKGEVELDEFGDPIIPENDTIKPPKIRKPLESYFFNDSMRMNEIFVWNVSLLRNKIEVSSIDTTISSLQPHYPFIRKSVGDAYQGNMGGASIPLNYADRPRYRNFAFAQGYDGYSIFPETAKFFNVKKPFTLFSYYTSGQSKRYEEGLYLTHAQNISPSSGFNIDYRSQGIRGFYNNDKGRDKNLSMAFSHTGKKYTIHAGYIYNTINNKENGGVVHDRFITDTILEQPDIIPVKLSDARNVIKGNTFYMVQSYGIPLRKLTDQDFSIASYSSLFIGHSMEFSKWRKVYTDTRAKSIYKKLLSSDWNDTESTDFYDNWYIDPSVTYDSIGESLLSNKVFLQIQPYNRDGIIGLIDAGIGMDNHKYYAFNPGDYITGKRKPVANTDYYVYGAINGKFKRYLDWGAEACLHPFGTNSGDLEIGANASLSAFIKGRPITLSGNFRMERRSPNYWAEQMFSNHFVWSNSFNKENETRLNVKLSIPSWALEIGGTQSVVTNKIYYDHNALPTQHTGSVSVSGLYADKDFRFGGFHLRHRVLLQWSTQKNVIPVPLASAYLSYYYEFDVVKNVLRAQIGLDGRYNTPYYAFGFMPATAQFYNQNEKEIGGYPMLDFYVSAKWKRMRILIKMEHLNENLLGGRNYFTLLHYPLHKRVFKFGFSWAFYD